MKLPRPLTLPVFLAVLCLGPINGLRAQLPAAPLSRHIELVSYGRDAGEVQVVVARTATTAQVRMIPTGGKIEIGPGSKLEIRQKIATPEGKPEWVRVAEAVLPPGVADFFVTLVPLSAPDETGLLYRTVVLGLENRPAPGSYTLANLTPVAVLVQLGREQPPVELAPWSQRSFQPPTDKKFRALMRVAYRATAGWEVLRSGVASLPPDQAIYGRVILAGKGMEELGAGSETVSAQPTVLILEEVRPAFAANLQGQ